MFKRFRKRKKDIDIDEVFLDATNLPDFDVARFEGRVVGSLSKLTIFLLFGLFLSIMVFYVYRIGVLQIAKGEALALQSENNRLSKTLIFSERGIITDRNGVELAWNVPSDGAAFADREYIEKRGYAHILGYLSYPKADTGGVFYQTEFEGKAGIEKYYNTELNGKSGVKIIETDALFNVQSENIISPPKDGKNITLSIDGRLQEKMYEFIKQLSVDKGFSGGAGIIMDADTGELLVTTSYPEYNPNVLTDGSDSNLIQQYVTDKHTPFLNRPISGLYTPGSIVKPFVAVGALEENIISPKKSILSTGSISIQSPYDPNVRSVFTDWRAQGWVDMQQALAVSSNVYFYEIGGGYGNQKGLGIMNIKKYAEKFGISRATGVDLPQEAIGVVPDPQWKKEKFNGEVWRIGDTYHTAIGQYGFQVTPIQMVRAVAGIANGSYLPTPHLNRDLVTKQVPLNVDGYSIQVVQGGMRQAVLHGTAKGLNVSYLEVGAKTGTAEVGISKARVNSWVMGFYPYDKPKYAFIVVMEKGPRKNMIGGLFIMRQMFDWMHAHTPDMLGINDI